MRNSEINRVEQVKNKWLITYLLETFMLSLGVASVANTLFQNYVAILSTVSFVISFPCLYFFRNHKRITVSNVLRLMSVQNTELQHSTDLLLKDQSQLTSLEALQLSQVRQLILSQNSKLIFPNTIRASLVLLVSAVAIFLLSNFANTNNAAEQIAASDQASQLDDLTPATQTIQKGIRDFKITISPPTYTVLKRKEQSDRDILAAEGARVKWSISFNEKVQNVSIRLSNKKELKFNIQNGLYVASIVAGERMFYELNYTDESGQVVYSDFHKIDIIHDLPPLVELRGLDQYTQVEIADHNVFDLSARLSDDYGLSEAYIIATIAQGSGESVMFREDRLDFDKALKPNSKNTTLPKYFDLEKMNMKPGDELYFYVETRDNSTIKTNTARTETYIISIRDTSSYESNMEGGLGIDLMPEYFRSQRQIIIDTEKLIANKANLTTHEFNSQSNELGFDQKSLRLKYGQFLGVEDESGIAIENHEEEEHIEGEEEDPLDGYKHDHDHEDEHTQVNEGEEQEKNPLEAYTHAHDSEEVATFLTNTLKSKLKVAMSLMWDAELYLRLYQPHNSLPYQYKALKLIKEIKNHARVYVHRIGFDPPPIKPESRLTADLSEVKNNKLSQYDTLEDYFNIKEVIRILNGGQIADLINKGLLQQAGVELAQRALENPGQFLRGLQLLRTWINEGALDKTSKEILSRELILALPKDQFSTENTNTSLTDLSKTYLQILEGKERNNERR